MSLRSPGQSKPTARLRLRVTAVAESRLRANHPWLLADSIVEQNREGELGELAAVYDRKDRFLAIGLYDRDSPIRLRVLHAGKPISIEGDWWATLFRRALDRRQELFGKQTTGFRCINGESDGWPGLVLDRYSNTLVLKIYTGAWLPRLEEIVKIILAGGGHNRPNCFQPERLVLRLSRNIQKRALEQFGRKDGDVLSGLPIAGPIIFEENGLKFEADVAHGQKTGFFLDQRENRKRVESLARGRKVLNTFSYSGGFSLYAARGGALSVTDLDLSLYALEGAKRNFALNQSNPSIASCRHKLIQADSFDWLEKNHHQHFQLVVLDPPSLARRESERTGAIRAYARLTELGIRQLKEEGILVACSCSAHVTAAEFFTAVRQAAGRAGCKFEELQTTGHAPDHPASIPEAEYLKAIFLKLKRACRRLYPGR